MKIYTRTGDDGKTALFGGKRVEKSHQRLEAYGTVDELNSFVGFLSTSLPQNDSTLNQLKQIQNSLLDVGSFLACEDEALRNKLPPLNSEIVERLETWIDEMDENLPQLKNFILPGGCEASSRAHLCRTICRRAERAAFLVLKNEIKNSLALQFLNRLSDYFFVFARWCNYKQNVSDIIWEQNPS